MAVKVVKKVTQPVSYLTQFNKKKKVVKKLDSTSSLEESLWRLPKGPSGRMLTEKKIKVVKKIVNGELVKKSAYAIQKEVGYKSNVAKADIAASPQAEKAVFDYKAVLQERIQEVLMDMPGKMKGANFGTLGMVFGVLQTKLQEAEGMLPQAGEIRIANEDRERLDRLFHLTGRNVTKRD